MGNVWDYFMRRKPLLLSLIVAFVLGGVVSSWVMDRLGVRDNDSGGRDITGSIIVEILRELREEETQETQETETQVSYIVQDALATAEMTRIEVPRTGGDGENGVFQDGLSIEDIAVETPAAVQTEKSWGSIVMLFMTAALGTALIGVVGYFVYQHFMR